MRLKVDVSRDAKMTSVIQQLHLSDSAVCTEVRTICVREHGATDDVCASEIETVVVVPCQS